MSGPTKAQLQGEIAALKAQVTMKDIDHSNPDLAMFKAKAHAVLASYAKANGMCAVADEAMEAAGLMPPKGTLDVPVTITVTVRLNAVEKDLYEANPADFVEKLKLKVPKPGQYDGNRLVPQVTGGYSVAIHKIDTVTVGEAKFTIKPKETTTTRRAAPARRAARDDW